MFVLSFSFIEVCPALVLESVLREIALLDKFATMESGGHQGAPLWAAIVYATHSSVTVFMSVLFHICLFEFACRWVVD